MSYFSEWKDNKWYHYLTHEKKKSMKSELGNEFGHENCKLIVQHHDYLTDKVTFGIFRSYLHFYHQYRKIDPILRTFSEVTLGHLPQKIRLDIDISDLKVDHVAVRDNAIEALIAFLATVDINISLTDDIIVTSSHGTIKYSYHIILDHYCVTDSKQVQYFLNKIAGLMNPEYAKYLDVGVCKTVQGLRMLGNYRIKEVIDDDGYITVVKREKIYHERWNYKGTEICALERSSIDQFEATLLSYIADCRGIYPFDVKVHKPVIVNEEQIQRAIELFNSSKYSKEFTLEDIDDDRNIIRCLRLEPSHCDICNRVHDNENSYILITSDNNLLFGCYRNESKKPINLGSLEQEERVDVKTEIVRVGLTKLSDAIPQNVKVRKYKL